MRSISCHSETLLDSFKFRRGVFIVGSGRDGQSSNRLTNDRYDRGDTLYLMRREAEEVPTCCGRLLPTTGAYMLPELFPQLLGRTEAPRDPSVWELTLFDEFSASAQIGRQISMPDATLELLNCVFDFGRANDIKRILLTTSIAMERLLLRLGLDVHRLAAPVALHNTHLVALALEVPRSDKAEVDAPDVQNSS